VNKGHGRVEVRECWLMRDTPVLAEFRTQYGWTNLHTLILVRRQLALSILKQDKSKGSLKGKRFKSALNDDFRLQLIRNLHA